MERQGKGVRHPKMEIEMERKCLGLFYPLILPRIGMPEVFVVGNGVGDKRITRFAPSTLEDFPRLQDLVQGFSCPDLLENDQGMGRIRTDALDLPCDAPILSQSSSHDVLPSSTLCRSCPLEPCRQEASRRVRLQAYPG